MKSITSTEPAETHIENDKQVWFEALIYLKPMKFKLIFYIKYKSNVIPIDMSLISRLSCSYILRYDLF